MIDHISSIILYFQISVCLYTLSVNRYTEEGVALSLSGDSLKRYCFNPCYLLVCVCMCDFSSSVPQPAGVEAQCFSGQQSLHPERLQRRNHLQVSDQVPLGAGEQSEETGACDSGHFTSNMLLHYILCCSFMLSSKPRMHLAVVWIYLLRQCIYLQISFGNQNIKPYV